MAGKISELTAATALNSADEVELLQGGTNKRLTELVRRTTASRWLVLSSGYTTTPISTSTLTVADPAANGIARGVPLRFKNSGTAYYCVVTAVSGTTVTIAGAPLVASAAWIEELAVGMPEMVVPMYLHISGSYAATAVSTTKLATTGEQYRKWRRGDAYLVAFAMTHDSSPTTGAKMNVTVKGNAVSTNDTNNGLQMSSTAGTWVSNSAVAISTSNYKIIWNDSIELSLTVVASSTCSDLNVELTFVME